MPALNQTLLNVVMIVAAGVVAPYFAKPGLVLAIGVFVAGFVQLVAQFPALRALGLLPRPRFDRAHEGVRRIARLMLPGIFGSSVAQVSLLLDTVIASFLMTGSITWLYYADRLVEFPLGVFSIALATVILPGLASHHVREVAREVQRDARLGAAAHAHGRRAGGRRAPHARGPADRDDLRLRRVHATATCSCARYALMAYSLGLIGFSMVKVLAPGYFARQDTKTPVQGRHHRALDQHGLQPRRRGAGAS